MSARCAFLLFGVGLLLIGSGCSGTKPDAAASARARIGNEPEAVTDFLREVVTERPALGYGEVVERLGPPIREQAEPASIRDDTLRTLEYYGLEITLREEEEGSSVARLALTDARYTSPEGLRVGHAESYVLEALGRPAEKTATRYFYAQPGPPPLTMVVTFERRAISRIEWQIEKK
jgi:hypothetical protein